MKNSVFFLTISILASLYVIFLADAHHEELLGAIAFVCAVASLICQTIEDSTK